MRERPQHSQIIQTKEKTCRQSEALQTDRQLDQSEKLDGQTRQIDFTYRQTDRHTVQCAYTYTRKKVKGETI